MSVLASGACGLACGRVLRYCAKCQLPNKDAGKGGEQNKSNTCEARALSREERYASGANSASCQSTSEWGYFFFEYYQTGSAAAPPPGSSPARAPAATPFRRGPRHAAAAAAHPPAAAALCRRS